MLLGDSDADVGKHTWPRYPVSLVDGALAMAQSDVWSPTAVEKRGSQGSISAKEHVLFVLGAFPVIILWCLQNIMYMCQNHMNHFHRFWDLTSEMPNIHARGDTLQVTQTIQSASVSLRFKILNKISLSKVKWKQITLHFWVCLSEQKVKE